MTYVCSEIPTVFSLTSLQRSPPSKFHIVGETFGERKVEPGSGRLLPGPLQKKGEKKKHLLE
jgi:hypothetical protein